nr:MAG TPA: hypothetical protein [Caudoviricetes sp.]
MNTPQCYHAVSELIGSLRVAVCYKNCIRSY